MTDVTFIGLGLMGAALAEAAMKAGHKVALWNRTANKADALRERGAEFIPTITEAIFQSPITIICVGSFDISDSILRTPDVMTSMQGKTIIQLTSGSARTAKEMHQWVSAAGARYVVGGIESYPDNIGKADSMFIVSGDAQGFEQAKPILLSLAPLLHYLGDDPTRAPAMYSAMLSGSFGFIFGVMNAVAICEATGITIKQYLDVVGPTFKTDVNLVTEMAIKCGEDRMEETEAFLSVWNETLKSVIETLSDNNCSTEFPALMHDMLNRAEAKGLGKHDLAALINVIRPN